ncbi:O-antigen ligase family protein [Rhodopseudomonas sp. RCAM05734]|uniref:O-antigen ligase family protein n=1 Tax=Rhodopseudomonas sp. RCAM05734 TaxID=3457549 RepID=UPI004043B464
MSVGAVPAFRIGIWPLPGWLAAAALIVGTAVLGGALGGLAKPLFVLGCAALGWYAWQQGAASHLQSMLVLFAFAPFVRRVVDLSAGFDQSGLLLIGPMLAILAPAPGLLRLLNSSRGPSPVMVPLLVVGGCVAYATALSIMQADWMSAASGALKWTAPLIYAAALIAHADRDEMVQAAAPAFLIILPIIGIYGIFQYVDPPSWDIYWMQLASIPSVGQPVPYGVRTFSTMNGPASFATFTAIGLIVVCFSRLRWELLLLVCPAAFALLLSSYRTAWISLAVGILFCLLFNTTRRKAGFILVGTVAVVVLAATLTPFGDMISDRFASLGEGAKDGSAQERMDEFVTLWNMPDSSLIGSGFTTTDVGSAGAMPVDGMIVACWLMMGIVVGLVCLTALVWAALTTLWVAWQDGGAEAIVIGALGCGALVRLPLANITSGENGFFFWTFAVLLSSAPRFLHGGDAETIS